MSITKTLCVNKYVIILKKKVHLKINKNVSEIKFRIFGNVHLVLPTVYI